MSKKLKIILTVSIILNVLLIGAVIGGVSKAHTDRGYKSQRMEQKLAEILNVLPESKSEEFKQRIDNLMQSKRADRRKLEPLEKILWRYLSRRSLILVVINRWSKSLILFISNE